MNTIAMQILRTRMVPGVPSRRRALVLCHCGQKFFTWVFHLNSGNTKSCGCGRATRHGWKARTYSEPYSMKSHPLHWMYNRWLGMMERCYSEKNGKFPDYGGRGIIVHPRWHDFENYLKDVGVPDNRALTIDRVDNDKGYGPDNWRWATKAQQSANTRKSKWL